MTYIYEKDLHKERCPNCGKSLYGKVLITLTEHKKPLFSFCVSRALLEELCAYMKIQGIKNPVKFVQDFWHDEYRKHGGNINWCSRVTGYRCLFCGTEIKYAGDKSKEEIQKHLETCSKFRNREEK